MLEVGAMVDGKYRILREIGHGGMSTVYLAINDKAGRYWAVKEIRKAGTVDYEEVKQGLIVETEMLKRLSHPNLPGIIDVIEDDDTLLIVMDYIEGQPLSKILVDEGAQPQDKVIEWSLQVCDVLEYLHTRQPPIIYRDMKPSNLMLRPDGQVILIDFGTAREFKTANVEDTTCLGTIGYAAPEQYGGMGQTDGRTDIYGLGATMYHLVTGHNPSQPPYEMKPIRQIDPKLSGGLESIILKCTRPDPNERYASCSELMYDLEHYIEMDDKYRKAQKAKLGMFIGALVAAFMCICCSVIAANVSTYIADRDYDNYISQAQSASYSEAKLLYRQCLNIPGKSGEKEPYLELIELFELYDDTGEISEKPVISKNERDLLETLVYSNSEALKETGYYSEICYNVGLSYWLYYYDNDTVNVAESTKWFEESVNYAQQGDEWLEEAELYLYLATFVQNKNTGEFEEGTFAQLAQKFKELMEMVKDTENETVAVRAYEYIINILDTDGYPEKFRNDNVSEDTLVNILNDMNMALRGMGADSSEIASLIMKIPTVKTDIVNAYSSVGEG